MNTDRFRHLYVSSVSQATSSWRKWYEASLSYRDWIYSQLVEEGSQTPNTEKCSLVDDSSIQEFFDEFEVKT